MNKDFISSFSATWLSKDTPWQFRILLFMVVLFFVGGILLDQMASNLTLTLSGSGESNFQAMDKLIIEFTKDKHKALTSSAALLYDFAKIGLGALIASITQNLKVDLNTENAEKS